MLSDANLSIRACAYIGDAVYELHVRKITVLLTENPKTLHRITSLVVNAGFHAELLEYAGDFLTETEKELVRRARNIPVSPARRTNQATHRLSTAFEAIIGHLYLNNPDRLGELLDHIRPVIDKKLKANLDL